LLASALPQNASSATRANTTLRITSSLVMPPRTI
jgi:hypothetical protein